MALPVEYNGVQYDVREEDFSTHGGVVYIYHSTDRWVRVDLSKEYHFFITIRYKVLGTSKVEERPLNTWVLPRQFSEHEEQKVKVLFARILERTPTNDHAVYVEEQYKKKKIYLYVRRAIVVLLIIAAVYYMAYK